ncbi:MAG: rhodanese-like domain-containing protein [Candidatus Zhuqueibacterota bacterium]
MKKLQCAMLLLVALTVSNLRASEALKANPAVFDFGTIREGQHAPVRFSVTNAGTKSIAIREIRTFAACIESKPAPMQTLKPGATLDLGYVFASLGYGGVRVDKKIEIHYNDSDVLTLRVTGQVLALEKYQAPPGELAYNFFALVDIRPKKDFVSEHILGAIHVPEEKLFRWADSIAGSLSGDLVIYLCCGDGQRSDVCALQLRNKGYQQFVSLVGGLKEWKIQQNEKWLIPGEH